MALHIPLGVVLLLSSKIALGLYVSLRVHREVLESSLNRDETLACIDRQIAELEGEGEKVTYLDQAKVEMLRQLRAEVDRRADLPAAQVIKDFVMSHLRTAGNVKGEVVALVEKLFDDMCKYFVGFIKGSSSSPDDKRVGPNRIRSDKE